MNRPSYIAVLRARGECMYVQATVVDVTVKVRIGRKRRERPRRWDMVALQEGRNGGAISQQDSAGAKDARRVVRLSEQASDPSHRSGAHLRVIALLWNQQHDQEAQRSLSKSLLRFAEIARLSGKADNLDGASTPV